VLIWFSGWRDAADALTVEGCDPTLPPLLRELLLLRWVRVEEGSVGAFVGIDKKFGSPSLGGCSDDIVVLVSFCLF